MSKQFEETKASPQYEDKIYAIKVVVKKRLEHLDIFERKQMINEVRI